MPLIPFEVLAVTQKWKWRTAILKTHSGLESRIAYLQAPSESWVITVAVDAELDRRDVRLALFQDPVQPWSLPLRIEAVPSQVEITGTSATIDSTYADWVAVDQEVMVEGPDPADLYFTSITVLGGTTGSRVLTLADGPPAGSFPAGLTRVAPVISVLLSDAQPVSREAADGSTAEDQRDRGAGTWQINARSAAFGATFGTGATLTTHDGLTVLDRRPIVETAVEEKFLAESRLNDYGAAISQEWSKSFADISRAHRFQAEGDAERQWWKKFFAACHGMQVEFLLPTWQPDLDLSSQPIAPYTSLIVDQTPGYAPWFASLAHKHLQLIGEDGSITYAKATAVVDNMDGTETITVSAAVGAGPFARLSLLELVRLGDDEVALEHRGDRLETDVRALVVQR